MYDSSLYSIENRLAEEGEELILYRFETGNLGFVASGQVCKRNLVEDEKAHSLWSALKCWLLQRAPRITAVCIPPGARLLLSDMPPRVQKSLCVRASELVMFTEVSSHSYSYRDALLLPNGTRVLLQDLPPGIQAVVLSASPETAEKAVPAEVYAA